MQRWGISESRLPLGSEILFREPTAWERYRWQITSILLALLVQSAMITWLLVERFGRRRAETSSRKLSLDVMHLNRAAEAGALSASFAHDLGQPTLAIALNAQRVENLLSKDRPELGKIKEAVIDISRANDHAAAIIKQFRKLLKRGSDPEIQQETDLNAVIADALSILSTEANHRQVVPAAEGHKGPLLVQRRPHSCAAGPVEFGNERNGRDGRQPLRYAPSRHPDSNARGFQSRGSGERFWSRHPGAGDRRDFRHVLHDQAAWNRPWIVYRAHHRRHVWGEDLG